MPSLPLRTGCRFMKNQGKKAGHARGVSELRFGADTWHNATPIDGSNGPFGGLRRSLTLKPPRRHFGAPVDCSLFILPNLHCCFL